MFQTRFTPPAICLALLGQHLIGHIDATRVSQGLDSHRAASQLDDDDTTKGSCASGDKSLSWLDMMS